MINKTSFKWVLLMLLLDHKTTSVFTCFRPPKKCPLTVTFLKNPLFGDISIDARSDQIKLKDLRFQIKTIQHGYVWMVPENYLMFILIYIWILSFGGSADLLGSTTEWRLELSRLFPFYFNLKAINSYVLISKPF